MRYLLIKYLRKPNGQIDEQVELSKNVKPKDIQTCNVIMDFKEKKVDKCFIEGTVISTDWDKLVEYYKQVYPEVIEDLQKQNP
jgi:coenzyme F420-reducing hydrogenase gamma subunit